MSEKTKTNRRYFLKKIFNNGASFGAAYWSLRLSGWGVISSVLGVESISQAQVIAGTRWQFRPRKNYFWAVGAGGAGQLGAGATMNATVPLSINFEAAQASTGDTHNLAIKTDGSLWAWGVNTSGLLGDGTTSNKSSPVQIGTLTNWSRICAGSNFSLALKSDGTLWAWGMNTNGQLGNGTIALQSSPVMIGSATDWSELSEGHMINSSLAIKSNGSLWVWGDNINGQLGQGDVAPRSSPVQVTGHWSKAFFGSSHGMFIR